VDLGQAAQAIKNIGAQIKAVRKKKGLTQQELGNLLGVSRAAICQYEKGQTIPSPDHWQLLADFLRTPVNAVDAAVMASPVNGAASRRASRTDSPI
jgi:transcriptional regulator with XRE-family HTH domain